MALSIPLFPSTSNYQNLALFICHLFIDGHFQTGHILHDPNAIQVSQLIVEIQSICQHSIPLFSTDVTEPNSLPWKPNKPTDHILQIIFFDHEHLTDYIDESKELLTIYHLLVHTLTDPEQMKSLNLDQMSPIIHFNLNIGSFCIRIFPQNSTVKCILQTEIGHTNLFELVFGKPKQHWLMAIIQTMPVARDDDMFNLNENWNTETFLVNFFYSKMNADFLSFTSGNQANTTHGPVHLVCKQKICKQNHRQVYKELSTEHQIVGNRNM